MSEPPDDPQDALAEPGQDPPPPADKVVPGVYGLRIRKGLQLRWGRESGREVRGEPDRRDDG
jgi:hypothetical protein